MHNLRVDFEIGFEIPKGPALEYFKRFCNLSVINHTRIPHELSEIFFGLESFLLKPWLFWKIEWSSSYSIVTALLMTNSPRDGVI